MRKTREEKGITLIALIITIVVLLILAVVAINAVTGDGIIQHATNARDSYENAQAKEQSILSYYQEYLDAEGDLGPWVQEKTVIRNTKTEEKIDIGSYVDYKSGVAGYTDENGWIVLGVKNGKILLASRNLPGEVEISSSNFDNAINILNKKCSGYDNGAYAVKGSARSINVDDINRVTGYNPLKTGDGEIYGEGTINQYQGKVTYTMNEAGRIDYVLDFQPQEYIDKVGQLPIEITECIDINGTELIKSTENPVNAGEATTITITNNAYGYNPITLTWDTTNTTGGGISEDSNVYKFLFKDSDLTTASNYWLASNNIWQVDTGSTFWGIAYYSLKAVNELKVGHSDFITSSVGPGNNVSKRGVRAVVTLEKDTILTLEDEVYKLSKN